MIDVTWISKETVSFLLGVSTGMLIFTAVPELIRSVKLIRLRKGEEMQVHVQGRELPEWDNETTEIVVDLFQARFPSIPRKDIEKLVKTSIEFEVPVKWAIRVMYEHCYGRSRYFPCMLVGGCWLEPTLSFFAHHS